MPDLIMCKGLPASGKTTWAKEQIAKAPKNSIKRVNKDDLRDMLDNGQWSKGNEDLILQVRDWLVSHMLLAGKNVIVDDTNLVPKHEESLRNRAKYHNCTFEIKDFTGVSVEECIERDSKRDKPVGFKVIQGMYDKFLAPKTPLPPKRPFDESKELCIVVDIDGTLAHKSPTRGYYDYSRVGEDTVHGHIKSILKRYTDIYILLVSGRIDNCKEITENWLQEHDIPYSNIFMRKTGDNRCDTVVKQELFEEHIEPFFNVLFVLDDRDRVVRMWRELGIPCLQVAEGSF
jgi:predicted kinase